ncbi:hypothetical protein ACQBEH_01595 [Brevibacillus laterosporus]|uniref:hypothetical protein n=1 Tax=Brevibacillus laterosporus TaxID=1465 RepID=UPI003CE87BFB
MSLGKCRFCKKRKAVAHETGEWTPICEVCLEGTLRSNIGLFANINEEEKEEFFDHEMDARVNWKAVVSELDSASNIDEIEQLIEKYMQQS